MQIKEIAYNYEIIQKNDKFLIIFGDKPFWFVCEESIVEIIKYLSGKFDYEILRNVLEKKYKYTNADISCLIQETSKMLEEAKLFTYENKSVTDRDMYNKHMPNPVINITKRCNLSCKHCYADANFEIEEKEEMTLTEITSLIDSIIKRLPLVNSELKIMLSGGEPFIRKDIFDIIKYIYDKGFIPAVNSNALLINDIDMILLKQYNVELLVSLDGSEKKTHEFIRGMNTYNKTIEKIKSLVTSEVNITISMTVHNDNLNEVTSFIDLAIKLGIKKIAFNPINILDRADKMKLNRIRLSEYYKILEEKSKSSVEAFHLISETDYANQGAILLMNITFDYCGVGAASLVVDYDGSVYPCFNTMKKELKLGNIKDNDIFYIWENSIILRGLRSLNVNNFSESCQKCCVKYYCGGGCRGEAYYKNKSLCSKCPYCSDIKESIIEFLFRISEGNNEIFLKKLTYYEKNKEFFLEYSKNH